VIGKGAPAAPYECCQPGQGGRRGTRRLYAAPAGVRVMQITTRPESGRSQASPIAVGSAPISRGDPHRNEGRRVKRHPPLPRPHAPLRWPPNFHDVTAEKAGTGIGMVPRCSSIMARRGAGSARRERRSPLSRSKARGGSALQDECDLGHAKTCPNGCT
jgi:hypothetical protein